MSKFIIKGNRALSGEIEVSGSKNAALPIIFATILARGVSVLRSVPDISDVRVALEILSDMGARVKRKADSITVDTTELEYVLPSDKLVSRIRASSYLLGANLARFGVCHLQSFGGCNFDNRPIDMHISAMVALGARENEGAFVAERLIGADIVFDKISVGATVNAILLASSAEGKSRIFGYAREPHVMALIDFLKSAGAKISLNDDFIEIVGAELHGASARIIPDMIEAGTYTALSLLTDSKIKVSGIERQHLLSFFDAFTRAGACLTFSDNSVTVSGKFDTPLDIVTEPYPGFPTDLQPQIVPLMAKFCGGTVTERVWKGRFGYLSELSKFGVSYGLSDSFATISASKLRCAKAKAPDLRGGAAILMCALCARGTSVVDSAEIIKRGYSDIVNKLRGIGAEVDEVF